MSGKLISFFLLSGLTSALRAQITLNEIVTVNLDSTAVAANPEYIGSNPAAIAWDGTDLYLAGFNNANAAGTVAICKVSGAITSPTFGTAFGTLATPAFRGYSGLDIDRTNGVLAAAYDDGTANVNGLTAWNLSGASLWAFTMRGGSGVGIDPRFPVGSSPNGVAWTQFGSGRRALQDLSGASIYTTSTGMVILTAQGSFWRDMGFDSANGDIWLREGNNVIHGVRSADNGVASLSVPFDPTDSDSVNQQNLAVCRTGSGAFVIFNDRATASPNQSFFAVMRAMRTDGTPEALDFGTFVPFGTGGGNYDFSFDAASSSLAILDSFNRRAHIFAVSFKPYYRYGSGCAGSNSLVPDFSLSGSGAAGSTVSFDFSNSIPNTAAFVLIGINQIDTPVFGSCSLLVDPVFPVTIGPAILDGAGAGSTTIGLPLSSSGFALTFQGLMIDAALPPFGLGLTNGMKLIVP